MICATVAGMAGYYAAYVKKTARPDQDQRYHIPHAQGFRKFCHCIISAGALCGHRGIHRRTHRQPPSPGTPKPFLQYPYMGIIHRVGDHPLENVSFLFR